MKARAPSRAGPRQWLVRRARGWKVAGTLVACCLGVLGAIALIPVQQPYVDFRAADASGARTLVRVDTKEAARGASSGDVYQQVRWGELAPSGWDPYMASKELRERGRALKDADPEAKQLARKLRDLWDNAPINPEIVGKRIRIPGYVVPLESNDNGLIEFLLVPYFGACIHTPAPPSNQILNVKVGRPLRGIRTMEPLWVEGTIRVQRSETSVGNSSYEVQAEFVAPYVRNMDSR